MKNKKRTKKNYYGTDNIDSLTYLEFGSKNLNNSKKDIWDFKTDQLAYDFFMLARYSREIVGFQDCKNLLIKKNFDEFSKTYLEEVHTRDFFNSLLTWIALSFLKEKNLPQKFYELGFTLFGCIDAHEICNIILPDENEIDKILYSGEEISYLLSELALKLHSEYKVEYSLSKNKLKNEGLFFSKGVTLLYALQNINDFFHYISAPKLAIFDYSFSLKEDQTEVLGTGKHVRYLSFDDFKKYSDNTDSTLLIRKSDLKIDDKNKKMRCHCLYGKEGYLFEYLKMVDEKLFKIRNEYQKTFLETLIGDYDPIFSEDYAGIEEIQKEFF